jgi:probable phosphoglycerate mutase
MSVDLSDIALLRQPFAFVRHGETKTNLDGIIAGWTDVPLTVRGLAQAGAAAETLTGRGITAIYVSGLSRAGATAACIAHALRLGVTVIPELNERCWGDLEGKPRRLRVAGVTPPGGETLEVFRDRILRGLQRIPAVGFPLIVSHSGVFRVMCALLDIATEGERVANATPMRFEPPSGAGGSWRLNTL